MTNWTPKNLVVKDGKTYQRWVSDDVPPRDVLTKVDKRLVKTDDGSWGIQRLRP